jgi:hypothetical protein
MANAGKIKGSAYEAKIALLLSKEFEKEFRRVPLSGAIDYLKGDIWMPHDTAWFPYCIECKHYKDVEWNNLLTAKTTDMYSFWAQTVREAAVMHKKPLLIFRWNRSKDFVAYSDEVIVDNYIEIKSFGNQFKIALLSEWLMAIKKQTNLAS